MMRSLISLIVIGLLFALPAYAVDKVMGGAVQGPLELLGLCAPPRTLSLAVSGTLATGIDGGFRSFYKAGGYENNGVGTGYLVATSAGNVTRLVTYALSGSAPVQLSNAVISTGNVPDRNSAYNANYYDATRGALGQFVVPGTRDGAPCPLTLCPHFRAFNQSSTAVDVNSLGQPVASSITEAFPSEDGARLWIIYTDQSGGFTLREFTSGFVAGLGVNLNPGPMHSLAFDGTFVYTIADSGGAQLLRRIRISTFAVEDVNIFGGTASNIVLYQDGFLYVGQSGNLRKVRTSDRTIVATMALQAGEVPLVNGSAYDAINGKFYLASNTGGVSTTIRRINLVTFTSEQFLNVAFTPTTQGTGYDFAHQSVYESNNSANVTLLKVTLCS